MADLDALRKLGTPRARAGIRRLVDAARAELEARAHTRVLALGDSHVRIFSHWLFAAGLPRTAFDVVYVPGGTAGGVRNLDSLSGAYRRFKAALDVSTHDLVLVNLGEVDTAHAIWMRAERDRVPVAPMLDAAVKSYCAFLDEVRVARPLAVLSAPLPTLPDQAANPDPTVKVRANVRASQRERTDLALAFNRKVAAFCATRQVPYLDADSAALGSDGLVRRTWRRLDRPDHHYARLPYALWLTRELRRMRHPGGVRLG